MTVRIATVLRRPLPPMLCSTNVPDSMRASGLLDIARMVPGVAMPTLDMIVFTRSGSTGLALSHASASWISLRMIFSSARASGVSVGRTSSPCATSNALGVPTGTAALLVASGIVRLASRNPAVSSASLTALFMMESNNSSLALPGFTNPRRTTSFT